MTENTCRNHNAAADDTENRNYESSRNRKVALFLHKHNDNRDIHRINRNDRKLRGVEGVFSEPPEELTSHKVSKPQTAKHKRKYCRVVRHIGFLVYLTEGVGRYTLASRRQRINSSRAAQHKSVKRTQAGNDNQEIDYSCYRISKVLERLGGTLRHKRVGVGKSKHSDVVQHVCQNYYSRSHNESNGEISLRILDFGIDRGGYNPALVGKRRAANSREQLAKSRLCRSASFDCREVLRQGGVGKSDNRAHQRNKYDRNKLY